MSVVSRVRRATGSYQIGRSLRGARLKSAGAYTQMQTRRNLSKLIRRMRSTRVGRRKLKTNIRQGRTNSEFKLYG